MTDFGQAVGQNVLDEALQELGDGQAHVPDLLGAVVAIAEGHLPVFQRFEPGVGNSDTEDVASEVIEDLLSAAGVLGVDDPFFVGAPEDRRQGCPADGGFESVAKLGAKDLGEHPYGQ